MRGERGLAEGGGQLFDAAADIPLRAELRHVLREFVAIDAVAAEVGATAGGVLDDAAGNGLADDFGELADAVVFVGAADIERLVVDGIARCDERNGEGLADIFNMYDGTPGGTVAADFDAAGEEGCGDEIVDHKIEP